MGNSHQGTLREKCATIAEVAVLFASICVAIMSAVENQRDKALTNQLDQAQSELLRLGSQIIKDGKLTTPSDFIAAYTEIEPLENEYDEKLDQIKLFALDVTSAYQVFDSRMSPTEWGKLLQLASNRGDRATVDNVISPVDKRASV